MVSRFLIGSVTVQSILWYESYQSCDHDVDKSKSRRDVSSITFFLKTAKSYFMLGIAAK